GSNPAAFAPCRSPHAWSRAAMGLVTRNVAAMVDAPRVRAYEIDVLSSMEVQAVLEKLRGRSLYPIASVALATGMRRGELLALRWQDVDFDGAALKVERALEQTKRGGLLFKPPKRAMDGALSRCLRPVLPSCGRIERRRPSNG